MSLVGKTVTYHDTVNGDKEGVVLDKIIVTYTPGGPTTRYIIREQIPSERVYIISALQIVSVKY